MLFFTDREGGRFEPFDTVLTENEIKSLLLKAEQHNRLFGYNSKDSIQFVCENDETELDKMPIGTILHSNFEHFPSRCHAILLPSGERWDAHNCKWTLAKSKRTMEELRAIAKGIASPARWWDWEEE